MKKNLKIYKMHRKIAGFQQENRNSQIFHKIISTRDLTVLTTCAIT